jgi:DNA mismatch endonuclease, patch repair protein
MADIFTTAKRSEIMSKIRGHGNRATEAVFIKILRMNRIVGWRRQANIFGKPDFVFMRPRIAVFIDGCFWHGCPKHSSQPTSNHAFWKNKIKKNKDRDRLVTRTLKRSGWRVIRIWQHDLVRKREEYCAKRIIQALESSTPVALAKSRTFRVVAAEFNTPAA